MIQKLIQDYFTFTKKERIAVISLMAMLVVIFSLPHFFPAKETPLSLRDVEALATMSGAAKTPSSHPFADTAFSSNIAREQADLRSETPAKRFNFDPNTLDINGWVSLGVKERTAATIQKYISKGGQFREPGDLGKIYGLSPQLAEELMPYVEIRTMKRSARDNYERYKNPPSYKNSRPDDKYDNSFQRNTGERPKMNVYSTSGNTNYRKAFYSGGNDHLVAPIDITIADSAAFESLPGIGPRLALRIISFREKLGGFYSVDQIAETFGLADSTFQKIRSHLTLSVGKIRKLSVNNSTAEVLRSHPYIRWNLANAIIAYRTEHGPFKDLDELKRIDLITAEIFLRISPYLEP